MLTTARPVLGRYVLDNESSHSSFVRLFGLGGLLAGWFVRVGLHLDISIVKKCSVLVWPSGACQSNVVSLFILI